MIMKTLSLLVAFTLTFAFTNAQNDPPKPEKWKDVTWHNVVMVKYQAGKTKRAREIIELYKKAGKEAGTKGPQMHWAMTGDYDAMFIWTMDEGPANLEWKQTADGIKWWAKFVEQQGSKEAAEKLSEEYASLVTSSTSFLTMKEIPK